MSRAGSLCCRDCGVPISGDQERCHSCGAAITLRCACGALVAAGEIFCTHCGTHVGKRAAPCSFCGMDLPAGAMRCPACQNPVANAEDRTAAACPKCRRLLPSGALTCPVCTPVRKGLDSGRTPRASVRSEITKIYPLSTFLGDRETPATNAATRPAHPKPPTHPDSAATPPAKTLPTVPATAAAPAAPAEPRWKSWRLLFFSAAGCMTLALGAGAALLLWSLRGPADNPTEVTPTTPVSSSPPTSTPQPPTTTPSNRTGPTTPPPPTPTPPAPTPPPPTPPAPTMAEAQNFLEPLASLLAAGSQSFLDSLQCREPCRRPFQGLLAKLASLDVELARSKVKSFVPAQDNPSAVIVHWLVTLQIRRKGTTTSRSPYPLEADVELVSTDERGTIRIRSITPFQEPGNSALIVSEAVAPPGAAN